jgi:hypothetical protein
MKRSKLVILLAFVLILATTVTVFAGSAYDAQFVTSITYQNVSTSDATLNFTFYAENSGTPISIPKTLPAGAGSSLYVGGLDAIDPGFNGSAVLSSDQPVVATMVQIPQNDANVKNRPLSNGFDAGNSEVLLATVLKNQFSTTSVFSVQNADSSAVDISIDFYAVGSATPINVTHSNLPVGAAKYFDMGTLSEIAASSFNGSAIINATKAGTSDAANVVATVMELSTSSGGASSFEGVSSGANTVYMASALCEAFGANSAYAVQNTSDADADVTVTYSNGNTDGGTISAGAKQSFIGCNENPAGYSGSATITSTGAIVVIGKVFGSGNSTAFVGSPSGAANLALPYVRFTKASWNDGSKQRAYIAIQNVGDPLAAGDVTVKYLNKDGDLVGTHTLGAMATGQKLNTNAAHADVAVAAGFTQADLDEFGYVGGFGGSVLVEGSAGSELVAVVRVQSKFGAGVVGEDYNGIPTQ